MNRFKFSFALIVAVLAVGITVVSNAATKRAVTACFETLALTNLSTNYTPAATDDCSAVKSQVAAGFKYLAIDPSSIPPIACQENLQKFCCIEFDLVPISDPNYSIVPDVDVPNETPQQKWEVERVLCRNL
ncbi:hypothetical protein ACWKWU_18830 [Chitinophaga lutea]